VLKHMNGKKFLRYSANVMFCDSLIAYQVESGSGV